MSKKDVFLNTIENGTAIKTSFMVMKVIFRDSTKVVCILADRSGEIKATIQNKKGDIKEGNVLEIEGIKDSNLEVKKYEFLTEYTPEVYLPTVKRPIEEIMEELDVYTNVYVTSKEGKALNDYFFKDEAFLDKFKRGIGGVSMHHNYIGGLAEHTLNVMYLTTMLCDRYDCRKKEIAVLAAKLHDIGKIHELFYDGPFKYTLRGEMEGHIVIGVQMLEKAFNENPGIYSDDFMMRMKACIVQHHGKLEYGSPREMKLEEAFILNYADSVDATMSKIGRLKDKTGEDQWSEYDRTIETKLYL